MTHNQPEKNRAGRAIFAIKQQRGAQGLPASFYPGQHAVVTSGLTRKHRTDILGGAKRGSYYYRSFYATATKLRTTPDMKGLFQLLTEEENRYVAAFPKFEMLCPKKPYRKNIRRIRMPIWHTIIDDRLYSEIDSREFVQRAIDT